MDNVLRYLVMCRGAVVLAEIGCRLREAQVRYIFNDAETMPPREKSPGWPRSPPRLPLQ